MLSADRQQKNLPPLQQYENSGSIFNLLQMSIVCIYKKYWKALTFDNLKSESFMEKQAAYETCQQ